VVFRLQNNTAHPRSGQVKHREEAKPSTSAWPGAAEKGFESLPRLRHKTARPRAEEGQAQRPGRTQRKSVFGCLLRLRQSNSHARRRKSSRAQLRKGFETLPQLRYNTARPRAEENQAQWPGRAQRRRGARESPPTTTAQLVRTPKKASRARGQAERSGIGGPGVFPRLQKYISHARRRRPSRAQRPGRAHRNRCIGVVFPTAKQHITPP
jgi:hypothetical protein